MASVDLQAVIFDVDGTLVDSERDGHRPAFNRAFEEAGLPDRWDPAYYGELLTITGGARRIAHHLQTRGMPAPERDALARKLHMRKTELFAQVAASGAIPARPGVSELIDELRAAGLTLGVATTGSEEWVAPLLGALFDERTFAVTITARQAPVLKPDPSAYLVALEQLGLAAAEAICVEDSANGLRAARAAGLPCVIVANDYSRGQDFTGAGLVLDGFGEANAPARVLENPFGVTPTGRLDVATLRAVWRAAGDAHP